MSEINKNFNLNNKSSETEQMINIERNILLNKFGATHLEIIKKKYLIKIL
jgi:hypothetical protein